MHLSVKITAFLIEQKIISNEDREIYEYGFELFEYSVASEPLNPLQRAIHSER